MIYPLVTLLLLVLCMFVVAFVARMNAVRTGAVRMAHYEIFSGEGPPKYVTKICNNLNNLLQVPPIFYAASVLAITLNIESKFMLYHAWGYVIARYLHTVVHVTYNNVMHRSIIFGASLYCLCMVWLVLTINILQK